MELDNVPDHLVGKPVYVIPAQGGNRYLSKTYSFSLHSYSMMRFLPSSFRNPETQLILASYGKPAVALSTAVSTVDWINEISLSGENLPPFEYTSDFSSTRSSPEAPEPAESLSTPLKHGGRIHVPRDVKTPLIPQEGRMDE